MQGSNAGMSEPSNSPNEYSESTRNRDDVLVIPLLGHPECRSRAQRQLHLLIDMVDHIKLRMMTRTTIFSHPRYSHDENWNYHIYDLAFSSW